jgi:hypothetical protein
MKEWLKDRSVIEWAILAAILAIILCLVIIERNEAKEKTDFMAYCQSKGNAAEDCRWEWKRINSGSKSVIMPPVIIPMGR